MKSVYKKQAGTRTSARRLESNTQEAPLTYFNDGGEEGGGVRVVFWGLKFWTKMIFWVYERRRDFFGSRQKKEEFFWVAKKD